MANAPESVMAPLPPPQAPGEKQYNAMVSEAGQGMADAWREDEGKKLLQSGQYSPADVDAYFGIKPPHAPAIAEHTEKSLDEHGGGVPISNYLNDEVQSGIVQPAKDLWAAATGPQKVPSLNPLDSPIVKAGMSILSTPWNMATDWVATAGSKLPIQAYSIDTNPFVSNSHPLTQPETEAMLKGELQTAGFMLTPEMGAARKVPLTAMGLAPDAAKIGANVVPTALRGKLVDSDRAGGITDLQ